MTDEQKDTTIGRLVRERKEAEERLAYLETETRRIGIQLANLGASLQGSPATVVFENKTVDMKYSGRGPVYNANDLNAEKVIGLTSDIRTTLDTIESLRRDLTKFGL